MIHDGQYAKLFRFPGVLAAITLGMLFGADIAAYAQTKQWTSASKSGDGSVFRWRGHAIGESSTTVLAREELNESNCTPSQTSANVVVCAKFEFPDPNAPIHQFFFDANTKKLIALQYIFDHHRSEEIYQLLVERYGKPSQSKTMIFQSNIGAKFDALVATWNTPSGPLVFTERYRRVDVSSIEMNIEAIRRAAAKPF